MKRTLVMIFLVMFVACASAIVNSKIDEQPINEPQETSCDSDECCKVDNERWCCFDDGMKIRCAKDQHVPLGNK